MASVLMLAVAGTSAGASAPGYLSVPHHDYGALDSTLGQIADVQKAQGAAAALTAAKQQNLDVARSKVEVTVTADAGRLAEAQAAVRSSGGIVENSAGAQFQALIAPAALETVAADGAVASVHEPAIAVALTDQGVASTNASAVQAGGTDGTGVKIAVIDLGFQNLTAAFGNPLPSWLSTATNYNFGCAAGFAGDTPHGTAVAEIVHAMAPGAQVELMCVDSTSDLAAAEQQAVADGVRIINHSVGWYDTGRGDGTGAPGTPDATVAAARSAGILWVNAAGNEALKHWSGTFQPAAPPNDSLNDFGSGDLTNNITIGVGQTACVTLKWDAWPVTTEDYDWGLVRMSNNVVVAESINDQSASPLEPTEDGCYTNNAPDTTFGVIISRYSAVTTPRMDLYVINSGPLQYATAAGSIVEPASSPHALAVGAACWQSGAPEPFSSQGPTIDGRTKPDLLGPDDTSSSIYGPSTGCTSAFSGTSASAPHVAGAAALILQRQPTLTVAQLEASLEQTAYTHSGSTSPPSNILGYGTLWLVVPALLPVTPPVPVPPPAPSGGGSGDGGEGSGGSGGGVSPDVSVAITANAATSPAVGSELIYQVTVADKPLTGAALDTFADVTVPAGYAVTKTYADRGPGCAAASPGLVCNLDFVVPGTDGHVAIWGTVGQAGPLTITVHIRHFLTEGNPADDTATLTLQPPASTGGGAGGGGGSGGSSGEATMKALSAPVVTGSGVSGTTLRARASRWSAAPTRVTYQWQLCTTTRCTAIAGASKLALKLMPAYAGRSVRFVATAEFTEKTVTSASKKIAVKKKK